MHVVLLTIIEIVQLLPLDHAYQVPQYTEIETGSTEEDRMREMSVRV